MKSQEKQQQAVSEEETGAVTGVLQTDTRGVSAAGLGRKAPGQVPRPAEACRPRPW